MLIEELEKQAMQLGVTTKKLIRRVKADTAKKTRFVEDIATASFLGIAKRFYDNCPNDALLMGALRAVFSAHFFFSSTFISAFVSGKSWYTEQYVSSNVSYRLTGDDRVTQTNAIEEKRYQRSIVTFFDGE